MRFQHSSSLLLSIIGASSSFSILYNKQIASRVISTSISKPSNNLIHETNNPTTKMNLFKSLFGGMPKSYIDYDTLDHPGPELADAAKENKVLTNSVRDPNLAVATFAGGCFWGVELAYQRVPGVVHTAVGYAQGQETEPTYSEVCGGGTGHTEAVIVFYDPKECTYESLLDTFFERVNPTTVNGQGNDFGTQYRTGVYFHTQEQETIARQRFEKEQPKYKKPIASELKAAMPFWPAEKYHQQYLEKGGRFNMPQDASKMCTDPIRCYG